MTDLSIEPHDLRCCLSGTGCCCCCCHHCHSIRWATTSTASQSLSLIPSQLSTRIVTVQSGDAVDSPGRSSRRINRKREPQAELGEEIETGMWLSHPVSFCKATTTTSMRSEKSHLSSTLSTSEQPTAYIYIWNTKSGNMLRVYFGTCSLSNSSIDVQLVLEWATPLSM